MDSRVKLLDGSRLCFAVLHEQKQERGSAAKEALGLTARQPQGGETSGREWLGSVGVWR